MTGESMIEETDGGIRKVAKSIAGSLGCSMKQLYNQPLKDILQRLTEYDNKETLEIIKRLANEEYIRDNYVDYTRDLLFPPDLNL
jgi:hypothetical protein